MTTEETLDLALEALEYIHEGANNQGPHTGISWRCVVVKAEPAIKAIKQARALDKKAENARELGLDYEPVQDKVTLIQTNVGIGERAMEAYEAAKERDRAALAAPTVQEPDHGNELTIAYMSGLHDGKKKREWVSLTDEERVDLWKATETDNRMVLIDAIEAKLKERNV